MATTLGQELERVYGGGCLSQLHRRTAECGSVDGSLLRRLERPRNKAIAWFVATFSRLAWRDEWLAVAIALLDRAATAEYRKLGAREMQEGGLRNG